MENDKTDLKAFRLTDSQGNTASFQEFLKKCKASDIVFLGEEHDNPIAHWMQMEVFNYLVKDHKLVLGFEMLERDQQQWVDAYMKGDIDYNALKDTTKMWNNFKTDYLPLVNAARRHQVPVIATNVPRKYASQVFHEGVESLEQLPEAEKAYMAPLPFPYDGSLPGYKAMLDMMEGHGGDNFPKAQAIKDATMAHSILEHWKPGQIFIHLNGYYHSEGYEGILWYLDQYKPGLIKTTTTTLTVEDLNTLPEDKKGTADYFILVPATMPRSY